MIAKATCLTNVACAVVVELMKIMMEYVMISTIVLENLTSVGFAMAQVLQKVLVIVLGTFLMY